MIKKISKDQIDEIVLSAKNGDNIALSKLYKMYNTMIKQKIYNMCKDNDMAKDITNDVWIKVIKNISLYTNDYSFSTWLHRVAKNYYLDIVKKKKINTVDLYILDDDGNNISLEPISDDINYIDDIIQQENKIFTDKILANIPPNMSTIIKLRYFDELSYDEIAKELNTSTDNIKTTLYRAKKMIKNNFNFTF